MQTLHLIVTKAIYSGLSDGFINYVKINTKIYDCLKRNRPKFVSFTYNAKKGNEPSPLILNFLNIHEDGRDEFSIELKRRKLKVVPDEGVILGSGHE